MQPVVLVEFGPELSVSEATSDLRFLPIAPPAQVRADFNSGEYRFAPVQQAPWEGVQPASWEEHTRRDALAALVVTTAIANFMAAMLLHWL